MASLFLKTPGPSQPLPKPHKTHFPSPLRNLPIGAGPKRSSPARIRCGLIEPDGGKLVELVLADETQRDLRKRQAVSLPQIKVSRIDIEWVHVISEGWASPLKGFMRESEFLQTLHFNSLRQSDGSLVNMSVPIVLAIDDSNKENIGDSSGVALVDDKDKTIAILNENLICLLANFLFTCIDLIHFLHRGSAMAMEQKIAELSSQLQASEGRERRRDMQFEGPIRRITCFKGDSIVS